MPVFILRQMTWLMLLPWLYAMTATIFQALVGEREWAAEAYALVGGGAIAAIACRLFRPLWLIYVAGHELTHALWALLFGQRVTAIKVRKTGGHVILSGTNSLITLAPYFFPFYGVVWLIVTACVDRWTRLHLPSWTVALGFGVTYVLHLVMTAKVLRLRQPDIESEGYVFSAVMVLLGNLAMASVLVPVSMGTLQFDEMIAMIWNNAGRCIDRIAVMAGQLAGLVRTR